MKVQHLISTTLKKHFGLLKALEQLFCTLDKLLGFNGGESETTAGPGCQSLVPDFSSLAQRDRHVLELCDRISKYLSERAPVDLVVLPELATIPYSKKAFERLPVFAETLSGASTEAFIELSQKINSSILFGMPYQTASRFFITQILVDPRDGVVEIYSKMHLCHYGASSEKDFFERGDKLTTFDLCGWKLAPLICYDIRFPEMARSLVLEHAVDFLIHAAAYHRDESFATWPHFAVTRAMENQAFLLSLNRAGPDYGDPCSAPRGLMMITRLSVLINSEKNLKCWN